MTDIPDIAMQHVEDFCQCRDKAGSVYGSGMDVQTLFHRHQPHIALQSRDAEVRYIRDTCDAILLALMTSDALGTDSLRYLLREVLSATFLAAIDRLCDPDFVNDLILSVRLPQRIISRSKALDFKRRIASYREVGGHAQDAGTKGTARFDDYSQRNDTIAVSIAYWITEKVIIHHDIARDG
jgi:hypothetical protein